MKEEDITKLEDNIVRILNSNMSFYEESSEDTKQYYLDWVSLAKLAYDIIQYAANIFGAAQGIISAERWLRDRWIRKKLSERESKNNKKKAEMELLHNRLKVLKENMGNEELKKELKKDIQEMLQYHGWPTDEANADSDKVLKSISE